MAAIVARPWRFTQLGGRKHTLVLDGPNAPYGRPRKGPVVETEREVREAEVRYPGYRIPTRHIFGDKQNEITLTGRFMDSRIGADGGAGAKADEVDGMIADQIPVRIEWGGIVAMTGLMKRFRRSFESEAEIAWTLVILIDTDDTQPLQAPIAPAVDASQQWGEALGALLSVQANMNPPHLPEDIEYQPSFLDAIANLLSDINTFSASISTFVDSVDNFESALFADVERFRAGVHQLETSVEKLQITLSTGENDAAFEAAAANSQAEWFAKRAETDALTLQVLALLKTMDLVAERAQRGTPDRTVRATGGDTWESLASENMGSAAKADALRQANGARYGAPPRPGQLVHVPKDA